MSKKSTKKSEKDSFLKKRPEIEARTTADREIPKATERRGRGRPPGGKRSNPDFEQVTIYIRKRTHIEAKKALLEKRQEFSELVEDLLVKWLAPS